MVTESLKDHIEQAARLIVSSRYVMALVGAGISVESGIPPFRGPGGLWTKYGEPDMNDYERFLSNPKRWWEDRLRGHESTRELYEALKVARPNAAHVALARLEQVGVLQSIITQNVDNLHQTAGSKSVLEIHGNTYKLRCVRCGARYPREEIPLEPLPPHCPGCGGLVKTDTVMFGEPIPVDVLADCETEARRSDCMLLIGTSATVYPAASFPSVVRGAGGTLIEANLYETPLSGACTVVLRASAAESLPKLVQRVEELLSPAR